MKKSLLFLMLISLFLTTMGFSQQSNWEWQNPIPTGNPLADIHVFDANTAITVGKAGSILKTTDGGNNWFSCGIGTNESMNSVEFVNSNTGWVVGTKGTLLKTTDGGTTWTIQPTGVLIELTSVDFLDSNTGWVAGDAGFVMKTTDGGISWTTQILETGYTYDLYDIQFINSNEGWVSSKGGKIWKTTDGGLTWTSVIVNSSPNCEVNSLYFVDSSTGWAVGGETPNLSIIVKTTDGGLTWIPQTSPVTDKLYSVYFTDINTGWAVASFNSNTILKTTDGGTNWYIQTTLPSGGFSKSICFANAYIGWVVGETGRIIKTIDGGINWTSQVRSITSESQGLNSVDFKSINIGWAVGLAGKIFKTTDGGATWISQTSGVTTDLKSVSFFNLTTGWVVGKSGTILKTTNGGTSWISQTSGTTTDLNDIFFINETTGWVVGQSGLVRKTTNGGTSWSSQTSSVTSNLNSVYFVDSNKGWAVGSSGKVIRTINGGTSWTNSTFGSNIYYSVHFITSTTGIMVGSGGKIYKTLNSGGNWFAKTSSTTADLYSVHSADGINVTAVGKSGVIRMSNDAGNTWAEEYSGAVSDLWSVFFATDNTGWIVGTNGTVLNKRKSSSWTGFSGNSWTDDVNWTDGVPLEGSNAIIAAANNQPTISTAVSLYNLSINTGAVVTVGPTGTLSVTNTLANSAGVGGFIIKSGGSLITTGTATALATVESEVSGGEWHLISSPVSGAVSGMFQNKYLQTHSENSNIYTDIEITTALLSPAKGYAVWNAGAFTAQYTGALNTGSIGSEGNLSRTTGGINSGWNLVGNPYASSIDLDAASGWTKINLNNATYIHVNMATWASYVGGTGTNGGSRYIAPCQGFFVQVTDGFPSATLAMNNSVRVHNATPFYKSEVSNFVRLQVSGNGYNDEAVVRFLPEATSEFDEDYDAHKLFGDVADAAQLYSLGSSSLAINSLPETSTVPVGVKIGTEGVYTISATEVNDISKISLEDTKTGIFTDLLKGSCTFSFIPGENEQRFVLHFGPLAVNEPDNQPAAIYSNHQTVYVEMKDNIKGDVFVYNIAGQLVASAPLSLGTNKLTIYSTGCYIVKVITIQSTLVRKVWIQ